MRFYGQRNPMKMGKNQMNILLNYYQLVMMMKSRRQIPKILVSPPAAVSIQLPLLVCAGYTCSLILSHPDQAPICTP